MIIEQAQMCAKCDEVEQVVSEAYQHIFENTTDLTPVEKAKRLGQTIVQLQDNNLKLQDLVQPSMPPEQVAERKALIEDIETKFEGMEKEAKTIMEATTQVFFWKSIVQDENLDQLTTQVQESKGQLTTLKTSLRDMPLMVHTTWAEELKDLHQ